MTHRAAPGDLRERYLPAFGGAVLLFAGIVLVGLLYLQPGPSAREFVVSQMLVNAILVLGLQIYVGNTGILSFGHMGFGTVAGYTVALLAFDPRYKERGIPDAPFGLADVHLDPLVATLVAVVVTLVLGALVGVALARSGARSGAVAATMITLALLFVAHEVAINWTDLTDGGGGLTNGPGGNLQGRWWIYGCLFGAVVVARLFRESPMGRLAQAGREDAIAADAGGIAPFWPQFTALLLSVGVVAVGASLRVQALGSMKPSFFFFDLTLLTLTMLIVGGRFGVTGALVGVVVVTAGRELSRYLAGEIDVPGLEWLLKEGFEEVFLGGSMLLFMILRPRGLLGDLEIDRWLARRRADRRVPSAADRMPGPAAAQVVRPPAVLLAEGVTVDFGGFRAVDGVSLEARSDEVVGLIGPNGAGKTTLVNVLTGVVAPTGGVFRLGPPDAPDVLNGRPPSGIARAGLARTFQNLRLFGELSVRENVAVADLVRRRYRPGAPDVDVDELLALSGLIGLADRRARELDYGTQRKLELARAAALAPSFLLLDEPTSGMNDAESVAMIEHVRRIAGLVGAGVLVIDHDLHFITGICDRVVVLDQGRVLAAGRPDEIRRDPQVVSAYLGTAGAR